MQSLLYAIVMEAKIDAALCSNFYDALSSHHSLAEVTLRLYVAMLFLGSISSGTQVLSYVDVVKLSLPFDTTHCNITTCYWWFNGKPIAFC